MEGLEGAGKSSVINVIETALQHANIRYITTREPGGTPLAEALRECVKQSWDEQVTCETELMLMYASRSQLVHNRIKPALAKGEWVIGDRHDLSSQAYQGGGREIDTAIMNTLKGITLGDFKPDLTLYLDVDPKVGLARARGRGELDRIEQAGLAFFERTRARYLALASADETVVTIDAMAPMAQVHEQVRQAVQRFVD